MKLGMTVGEMGRRMSGHELIEWMAFFAHQHKVANAPPPETGTREKFAAMCAAINRQRK